MHIRNYRNKLLQIKNTAVWAFILFTNFTIIVRLVEAITYSGFIIKHFQLDGNVFLYFAVFFSFVVVLLSFLTKKDNKQYAYFSFFYLLNIILFTLLIFFGVLFNVVEANTYTNFIYSHFHINPELLFKPILISGFSLLIWNIYRKNRKSALLKKNPKLIEHILDYLNNKNKYFEFIFGLAVMCFVVVNIITFVSSFYKFSKGSNKNFFKEYFSLKIDINSWVKGTFPLMGELVLWCDKQNVPTKLVTFDPEIIWTSYEGMSRVYLTNCYYGDLIDPSGDNLKDVGTRLVSTVSCDKELLKIKTMPDPSTNEYYKIINNKYICSSKQIFTGLYLYEGEVIK